MKRYLTAAEVAELAELLESLTFRTELVDRVLDAAKHHRGMTLILNEHLDQTNRGTPKSAADQSGAPGLPGAVVRKTTP